MWQSLKPRQSFRITLYYHSVLLQQLLLHYTSGWNPEDDDKCVYEFLPSKGRNNYNSVIITLLPHWSSDEEQAVSTGPKSGAPPLPFA